MIVERADFVSLPVTDVARSRQWYKDTLGLPLAVDDSSFPEFQLGENVSLYLISMESIGSQFGGPHTAHIALRVPDVAQTRSELESRGVEFAGDTLDTGVCHMAFFHDPDGNALMLHRRYAPRD